jgi:hypothetical protein
MEREELVRGVKHFMKNEWPKFKADVIEEEGDEFNEEDALDNFKEIMIENLSDLVVEVWAEL